MYISKSVNITGTFTNNFVFSLTNAAVMSVTDAGSYNGSGYIYVYCEEGVDISSVIQGVDLTNFEKVYNSNYHYWKLRDISGLTRLGTPTDLEWGYEHSRKWNSETQDWGEWLTEEEPGMISWKPVEPDQGRALINVYREDEETVYKSFSWSFGSTEIPEWRSITSFLVEDPESGTYYFTVTSEGDFTSYTNSETVKSDTWTYVRPSEQVGNCSNLSWDWPRMKWDAPSDDAQHGGYQVETFYATDETETPVRIGSSWWYYKGSPSIHTISDSVIQGRGNGYYYFRVRALSDDITVACNGEWSELSKPYILTELSQNIEEELDTIIYSATTAEAVREAVQNMDTEELKSAMLADQSNTGTVEKLSQLEVTAGGAAPIDITDEVSAFDESKVSVVGANLNNSDSVEEPITLVLDKPEKEDVIPAAYDNSVAIRFSMTLDNVEDPENLKVPVKITLPVPTTINPEFLVILHYHAATGEAEELHPYVYSEDGQYYASFVLTSFSDFVMTQTVQPIEFEDVEAGSYYEDAVKWAVNNGITNGYGSGNIFNPEGTCTRAQIVTFLWRANGSPEPSSLENSFTDVASDTYYYKAVLWAVENGITAGYGKDTIFNPDGSCTRGQVATFLWRAEGKADMSNANNLFTDLADGAYYYDAVLWAVENGITNGYGSDTIFNPDGICTRGQIVTFLYRAMN